MRYEQVCLGSLAHELPPNVVSSSALEDALAPVYRKLGLNQGRLELMSGVRERRFWDEGTPPSVPSVRTARQAIARAGLEPGQVGALLHTSVCRDCLEPATASIVGGQLGLAPGAFVFDLSNACLGFMNGLVTVANMIELGQIEAGVVVATESGRPLVDATVRHLVSKSTNGLARKDLRPAFASLTIGSGSVAAVLTSRRLAKVPGRRLLGGAVRQATEHHALCRSAPDQGFAGEAHPLMDTDAEAVLQNGTQLAAGTWRALMAELGWENAGDTKLFCHQVGASYRRQLFAALDLDPKNDHPTLDALGNVGSVSCPISLSMAIDEGRVLPGDRLAMLGIGSGLNSVMLGLSWA